MSLKSLTTAWSPLGLAVVLVGGVACSSPGMSSQASPGTSDGPSTSGEHATSGDQKTSGSASAEGATASDTGSPPPPPSGSVSVAACAGHGGFADHCGWDYLFDASACGQRCTKMVAFFAGGEQDCDNYGAILEGFASRGYLATCITLFESNEGTGASAFAEEAARVDTVLADIRESAVTQALWTGQHFLISGISHGATVPPIAMARTDLDQGAHWRGEQNTGACFLDGIYDIAALDTLLGTGAMGGGQCILPVSHARMIGRYYDSAPATHDCDNGKCACAKGHDSRIETDIITSVDADAFSISDWKLIECGSGLPSCIGDIVPAEPIEALCQQLDAAATHSCAFESMPRSSHIACAEPGSLRCIEWFDARTE